MNTKPNDGGPAFPLVGDPAQMGPQFRNGYGGMTLRDYFAAAALGHIPALLDVCDKNASCENIAKHAYMVADAMLTARES